MTEPIHRDESLDEQLRRLQDENEVLQAMLLAIGSAAVPALAEMLENPDWRMRASAASMLAQLDPFPEAAVPGLFQAIQDEDFRVRKSAGYSLEYYFNLRPWMLRDRCCRCAVPLADRKTPDQEPFMSALKVCINDTHPDVRVMAVGLLGRLGAIAKPAFTLVQERLKDENKSVRYYARQALVQIDPEGAEIAGVT